MTQNKTKTPVLERIKVGAYWFFTILIAQEMIFGSMWDLLQIEYVRVVFTHLELPFYLLLILGAWKLPGGAVMLLPRFLRLKEWAYAGAVFNYSGAAASHLLVGDGPDKWVGPLVYTFIALASWALRPEDRRLSQQVITKNVRALEWIITIGMAIVLLIAALLTLPKGSSPGNWTVPMVVTLILVIIAWLTLPKSSPLAASGNKI
jgi:hypothetical protein